MKVTAEDLQVGTMIKVGPEYAKDTDFKADEVVTLVCGYFEEDNGLYTYTSTCPSLPDPDSKEFDSIFHLFENDLRGFKDCEIVGRKICQHENKTEYNNWAPTYCLDCNEIVD